MDSIFIENLAHNCAIEQAPGLMSIKDIHSQFVICSAPLLKLIGFKSNEYAFGKTDFDLQCQASEHAEQFIKQDKTVISANREFHFICFDTYADGNRHIFIGHKKPIYDTNGVIQALWANATEITHQVAHFLSKTSLEILLNKNVDFIKELASQPADDAFTKTERKVIFLLVHGYNANEIAKILHRSKRTIETHIENTRSKLQLSSTPALIDYLNSSKYDNFFITNI